MIEPVGDRNKRPMENRILIVDDEKMIYSVIARRLAKEGYPCVMANSGRSALSRTG
jgi:CheY-like chemotaxis protein